MSLYISAFHIDRGPSSMFPVDVAHAVGNHPNEWSRVPWTDDTRAAARKRAQDAKDAADASKVNRGDRRPTAADIASLQTAVDQAQSDADDADRVVTKAKAGGDEKQIGKAQREAEAAHKKLDEAKDELDAAKADAGKTDAGKK